MSTSTDHAPFRSRPKPRRNILAGVECFLHWQGRPARWKIQRLHEMWFDGGIPLVIVLDEPESAGTDRT